MEFAVFGRLKGPRYVTFIVRGRKGEDATTAVRLRADTAVRKARELAVAGWYVFIESLGGDRTYPEHFDKLLSDRAPPPMDLGVAV